MTNTERNLPGIRSQFMRSTMHVLSQRMLASSLTSENTTVSPSPWWSVAEHRRRLSDSKGGDGPVI
jgi:hypothetical protein